MADGSSGGPELGSVLVESKERPKDNRGTVLESLNKAFIELKSVDSNTLTLEQQQTLRAVEGALSRSLNRKDDTGADAPKDTLTVSYENPQDSTQVISQEEGIPVEGLLQFIKAKVDSYPKGTKERNEWLKVGRILYRNSYRYSELHPMDAVHYVGRVRLEAKYIYSDERKTADAAGDYFKGEDTMVGQQREVDDVTQGTVKDVYESPKDRNRAWYRSDGAINRRLELVIPNADGTPSKLSPTKTLAESAPSTTTLTTPAPEATTSIDTTPPTVAIPNPTETPSLSPNTGASDPETEITSGGNTPTASEDPDPRKTLDELKKDFVIVNASPFIRKKAREMTEEHIRSRLAKDKWWQVWTWPKRTHLRVTEEYQKLVIADRLTQAMRDNNFSLIKDTNLRKLAEEAVAKFKNGEAAATVGKVQDSAKEGVSTMDSKTEFATRALKQQITDEIIKPVINGTLSSPEQVQAKLKQFITAHLDNQQIERVFGVNATQFGVDADYFATNILESALELKSDLEAHQYSLDQIDQAIGNIQLNTASWSAETEEDYNRIDKAMAWVEKNKLRGWVLNPATVGAAASVLTFFSTKALGAGARATHIATPLVGALVGGVFAGLRRNQEIKSDMAMTRRQEAQGKVTPDNAPRLKELKKYNYNTATVKELIEGSGNESMTGVARQSMDSLLSADLSDSQETNRRRVLRRIAEIQARQDFSDQQKVDLIHFGNEETQKGRWELTKNQIKAIKALENAGMDRDEITLQIREAAAEWNKLFIQNKEQQDNAFKIYRTKQALWSGFKGGVGGLLIGFASQQILAEGARRITGITQVPVIGGIFKPGQTVGERLVNAAGTIPEAVKNAVDGKGPPHIDLDVFAPTRVEGFASDNAKDLFAHSGEVQLSPHLIAHSGNLTPDGLHREITISDAAGNPIQQGTVDTDGKFDIPGTLSDVKNSELKDTLLGTNQPVEHQWTHTTIEDPNLNDHKLVELYNHPGEQKLPNGITLRSDAAHHLTAWDAQGTEMKTPTLILQPDGKVTELGKLSDLPDALQKTLTTEGFTTQVVETPSLNTQKLAELYNHPGTFKLGEDLNLKIDGLHHGYIETASGEHIPTPSIQVTADGHAIVGSGPMPDQIKIAFTEAGLQRNPADLGLTLHNNIQEIVNTGKHGTITLQNATIDIDTPHHTFSVLVGDANAADASTRQLHGIITNSQLSFDLKDPANAGLDWSTVKDKLAAEGWKIDLTESQSGQVSLTQIDQLLSQSPDILKQQGIIETGNVHKTWIPHVANPEFTARTGLHTGNELTGHIGGQYTVDTNNGPEIRTDSAPAGQLRTFADLTSGPIPAHIDSLPPRVDSVLSHILEQNGGLDRHQMVAIVDLNDGRQFTIPFNDQGVAQLPQEFYLPNGQLVGVKTVAWGFLVNHSDNKIIDGHSILTAGKIPTGMDFHELASEKFLSAPSPLAPVKQILHIAPPATVEFAPPAQPITTITPPIDTTHTIIAPPPPIYQEQAPMIPFPFAPRYPLEELIPNVYNQIYNEQLPLERQQLFEKNKSDTLKNNSEAELDPYTEVTAYFNRQDPEYLNRVKELSAQIPTPPSPNLRAEICIPVAGHEEGAHIYDTLVNYTYQNAPSDQYEILLFVNYPAGVQPDNTMDEIKRFQREHSNTPVRVINRQMDPSEATMSVIRKYLNDVALYRQHQQGPDAPDLILISNDADLKGLSPDYVKNFIEKFDNNPSADGLVGQLDWDPASYIEYPAIHAGTRLFQYLNMQIWKNKQGDRSSSGANFAFKSSIYAGVGGYQVNDMPGAEDVILGQAIRAARKNNHTVGYAGARVSRLYTSSRRSIDAWKNGFAPIEQWDRNWQIINGEIRSNQLGEHKKVDYSSPTEVENLRQELAKVIDRTLDYYNESGDKQNPIFKRAVGWLGIDYTLNSEGKVEITDMSKFLKGINNYQEQGKVLQDIKSGKLPSTATISITSPSPQPTPPTTTTPLVEPLPNTAPIPTETAPTPPVNLVEGINQKLEVAAPTAQFETTPTQVIDFLKTVNLPNRSRIQTADAQIVGGQLVTQGIISTPVGQARFTATLENDPAGGLRVVNHTVKLPLLAQGFKGQIDSQITNLNGLITSQLDKNVKQGWKVQDFRIDGDKLVFNFKNPYYLSGVTNN